MDKDREEAINAAHDIANDKRLWKATYQESYNATLSTYATANLQTLERALGLYEVILDKVNGPPGEHGAPAVYMAIKTLIKEEKTRMLIRGETIPKSQRQFKQEYEARVNQQWAEKDLVKMRSIDYSKDPYLEYIEELTDREIMAEMEK